MSALVDHPLVLIVALAFSAPIIWQIARSWFADIKRDAEDAVVPGMIDALGGPMIPTWLLLKVLWFSAISAAIVITFYEVGAWIAEL
jgi:hypothetical protein